MTGATFWLYRLFYFHLSGGFDKRFLKTDKKVNKIMMKAYEKRHLVQKKCAIELLYGLALQTTILHLQTGLKIAGV